MPAIEDAFAGCSSRRSVMEWVPLGHHTSIRAWVASCVLLVVSAIPARAQLTTGTIVGKVVDQSGSALPGTAITVASPSLIRGTQAVTSQDDGAYRVT